jgi:hypothetical protein
MIKLKRKQTAHTRLNLVQITRAYALTLLPSADVFSRDSHCVFSGALSIFFPDWQRSVGEHARILGDILRLCRLLHAARHVPDHAIR